VSIAGESTAKNVIIHQHPCAIRAGVNLLPKLLVAEVNQAPKLMPSDWPRALTSSCRWLS